MATTLLIRERSESSTRKMLDESLSKGLATRFFQEHTEVCTAANADVLRHAATARKFAHHPDKWRQWLSGIEGALGKTLLSKVENGSKRKFLTVFHFLGAPDSNPVTEWNEPVVPIMFRSYVYPAAQVAHRLPDRCYVSKHAFARLIQRLGLGDGAKQGIYDFYMLNEELSPLVTWSTVWMMCLKDVVHLPQLPKELLALPIPSPNGMFFATLNMSRPLLNIRTWVHDRQLSAQQLRLKTRLMGAMDASEADLISCMSEGMWAPGCGFTVRAVCSRLSSFSQEWLEAAFEQLSNSADRVNLQALIRETVEAFKLSSGALAAYQTLSRETLLAALRRPDGEKHLTMLLEKAVNANPSLGEAFQYE